MLLSLRGIRKAFDGTPAVDGVSLDIDEGELVCFLGPSGCGKTTLLRMVAGLETPDAGEIRFAGRDLTAIPARERNFGIVFQSYSLFPNMTVARNIAYGLECRGWKRSDIPGRIADMLALVNLSELAARLPHQLSGGQQQRVALARAVVNRPALLLLDEPLGALDLKLRRQMQLELKSIQNEVGLTFLHVTHDQEEAMTMADTVAVMNKGQIEQMGAPEELYELPKTAFVANFLGQSNLFTGSVTSSKGDTIVVDVAGVKIEVPKDRAQRHQGEVTIGVRPEKIILHTSAPKAAAGVNVIGPGRVVDVSFSGVSTQYQVEVPGMDTVTVFAQNMVFGPVVHEGAEVWMAWTVDHGFGLVDEPEPAPRFASDTDTRTIAVQTRDDLIAEMEEA